MAGATKLMTAGGGGVNLTPASSIASDVTVQVPSVAGTVVLSNTSDQTISGLTVGKGAGSVSTNTAVGASAFGGASNSGGYGVAVGTNAGVANTTATGTTAVGWNAGAAITSGSNNAAFGADALSHTNTGASNTAVGNSALGLNTTASNNTAVGYQAGYSATTAYGAAYLGYQSGYSITTGVQNSCIGAVAGYSLTTGYNNTFVGNGSGYYVSTGNKNTIVGLYNGNQGGLDIRTSSNNIVLSDGDGNPRCYWNSQGEMFQAASTDTYAVNIQNNTASMPYGILVQYQNATPNGTSNQFLDCYVQGNARVVLRSNGGIANYSANNANLSDRREKTNFAPAKSYLDVICAIPVQTYNYIDQDMENDGGLTLGVVAQDVQEVAPEFVSESNWGTEEEPKMRLSIYQTDLQYALMKCIQELKADLDATKAELQALKGQA